MTVRRVALLTAGGLAPCLSSAVGALIERYTRLEPEIEIIGYRSGYAGLLQGDYVTVTPEDSRVEGMTMPPLMVTGFSGAWGKRKRRFCLSPSRGTSGSKSWPLAPRPCNQITVPITGRSLLRL